MKVMKKVFDSALAGAAALGLLLTLTGGTEGCMAAAAETADTEEELADLTVFAAASMTETLTQIAEIYEKEHPGTSISFNFDSSGTLKTQILQGAECDIFLSAAQKQMNELDGDQDSDANPEGNDYLLKESRTDLLENKVALAVPEGNPKGIQSFDDLAKRLEEASGEDTDGGDSSILLAMGNSDVPVGQYTEKIFSYYGLSEEKLAEASCITYGSNVKEVTTQVSEASVDCGIIYATDAAAEGLTVVDTATPDMCGQVIYPAAVLKESKDEKAAVAFLEYLKGEEARKIFEKAGFTPVEEK